MAGVSRRASTRSTDSPSLHRQETLLGLVGGLLLLTSAVFEMFAYGVDPPVGLQLLGAAPIALQEMVLAVLLIWKGFAAPSVAAANGEPGPESG